jgi:hypothetical protein
MDDETLDFRLGSLDWLASEFAENAEWAPSDTIPQDVANEMKARGRFYGEEFVYYMSKRGNISRYPRETAE